EHLARPARIPGDPGGHGQLIVGRAAERLVAQLAREALRDSQRFDRLATALEKIEGRASVQPYSSGIAHREISRVERSLGAAQPLRSRCECEEARDRTDLELSLAPRTLKIRVVEEVRSRLVELLRHVLERPHRRTDLAALDRAHVR